MRPIKGVCGTSYSRYSETADKTETCKDKKAARKYRELLPMLEELCAVDDAYEIHFPAIANITTRIKEVLEG